uniref:Solute carrier family 12 member 2 n=1 Tax=Panagrolaimus superbus TaxID=310955 RepID=A0A914YTL2_9BILA
MQSVLLAIIIASIFNFYIGCLISPSEEKQQKGMTGFKAQTFIENFYPSFRDNYHFFSVFAIYFPAATGIMAGANISGDLKNSTTAIPKGTILGILVTTAVYLSVVWISGATVVRDADGVTLPMLLENSTAISNDGWLISSTFSSIFGSGTQYYAKPDCAFDNEKSCQYGIVNDSQIFNLISWWSPLVIAGVLTSTLSSALLSLVSAPKIFQSVAQDKLFPYIGYFSTGFRKGNSEPQKAYIFAFLLCCLVVLIGNLNAIASVISNFYLSTYALINFACFDNSFAKSPGFRPSFKYYHQWISLLGAILCVCVMFIISYQNALITFMFFGLLFFYMAHRKPDVNWGSSKQAHAYRRAIQSCQKLEKINEHVKNYRPQILVLCGNPASRPSLVDFAHAITKGNSLLVCGHVIPKKNGVHEMSSSVSILIQNLTKQIKTWFSNRRLKAFYFPLAAKNYRLGIQCLLQGSGLGKLKPNILFMGYKQNWDHKSALKDINDYFGIILDAFNSQMGVCILRNGKDGFDFSNLMMNNEKPIFYEDKNYVKKNTTTPPVKKGAPRPYTPRQPPHNPMKPSYADSLDALTLFSDGGSDFNICRNAKNMEKLTKEFGSDQIELLTTINVFRLKIEKGVIDIWWLYDDGGLSVLIPYLLTQSKSYLEGSKLRIFTLANNTANIDEDREKLEEMLLKFRIEYDEIIIVKDDGAKPKPETIHEFERIIGPFCVEAETLSEDQEGMISKTELNTNEVKTMKMLKIAEYLRQHSSESNLIVITLPVPKKELIGGTLYMAWLEIMTKNLPPSLFVRGNQTSVLTLYS